jgi:catechol 2,3-dioxygenase-like lactoylglutathione lyase family enzyme
MVMTSIALTVGHVGLNVSDLDRSQAFYTACSVGRPFARHARVSDATLS